MWPAGSGRALSVASELEEAVTIRASGRSRKAGLGRASRGPILGLVLGLLHYHDLWESSFTAKPAIQKAVVGSEQ